MADLNAHTLLNEAREIREQLAALGGDESARLLAKIDAKLALHHLHGGQCISLRNWLDKAGELLK